MTTEVQIEMFQQNRLDHDIAESLEPDGFLVYDATKVWGIGSRNQCPDIQEAKLCAIIGSCPRSTRSMVSGTKCYIAFAVAVDRVREAFPINNTLVLAWSSTFRCHKTFKNYVGYIRTANSVLGYSNCSLDIAAVGRAETIS